MIVTHSGEFDFRNVTFCPDRDACVAALMFECTDEIREEHKGEVPAGQGNGSKPGFDPFVGCVYLCRDG